MEDVAKQMAIQEQFSGQFERAGIDYNTWALTSCEILINYVLNDPDLRVYAPWINRVLITSNINEREARMAVWNARSQIIRGKLFLDEDEGEKHLKFDALLNAINFIIRSDIGGWRGLLVGERRARVQWVGEEEQERGGFWRIFRR